MAVIFLALLPSPPRALRCTLLERKCLLDEGVRFGSEITP